MKITKKHLYFTLTVIFVVVLSGVLNNASASSIAQHNLQSIMVWESSSTSGGPDSYYFNAGDSRLASKISFFGANSSNDMSGTVENYDIYLSDANGNLNSSGSYITIDSYRNADKQNVAVGGNISAVQLNFNNGTSIYASNVARVVNGTGLSGVFASTQGYANNALGAPIPSGQGLVQPAPGFKCTYLGDHFSSITLGFVFVDQNIACNSNSDCGISGYTGSSYCQGSNIFQNYMTYTCNGAGTVNSYCSSSSASQLKQTCSGNQTCNNGVCSGQNCTYHSYQQCVGNSLYWYDSCGQQQEISQYCQNGCYGNTCSNYNNNNYCTYHAYRLCVGNSIYWYDSCGARQDLFQTCYGTNQICQYGVCTYNPPAPNPNPNPYPYISHYKTECYSGNLYWYDSLSQRNSLYKDCADANSCTIDTCASGECSNEVKCDGTTCAIGSADYQKYCASEQPVTSGLSISFFAKEDESTTQWQKAIQVGENGHLYFMIAVANNETVQVDNLIVSANIPSEVVSLGNVQVNGIAISGDIVNGLDIGSVAPATAKTVTFEGMTQTFSTNETKQSNAKVTVGTASITDTLGLMFNPGQVAGAAISESSESSFWDFVKRWYLWILVALVLIFLFVVVFRRLSSNA